MWAVLCCAGTRALMPPHCTYWLCVASSCVLYAPEAQGSLSPGRLGRYRTRTAVRARYAYLPRACRTRRVPWHPRWFGFFAPFFTMFASAPLMNEIRKPSSLNLSTMDIVHADICAVPPNIVYPYPYP